MCLIFTNKIGTTPNYLALENAYRSNPDGFGILLWDGAVWTAERFIDSPLGPIFDRLEKAERFAIHFRYATHGTISIANCHPFSLGEGWFLMHNGILPFTPTKPRRSDTWQLCQYLKAIKLTSFDSRQLKSFLPILKEAIGGDRILIARPNGKLIRLGNWTEREEGFYSNSGCLTSKPNVKHIPISPLYNPRTDAWDGWDDKWEDDPYVIGGYSWDNWRRK